MHASQCANWNEETIVLRPTTLRLLRRCQFSRPSSVACRELKTECQFQKWHYSRRWCANHLFAGESHTCGAYSPLQADLVMWFIHTSIVRCCHCIWGDSRALDGKECHSNSSTRSKYKFVICGRKWVWSFAIFNYNFNCNGFLCDFHNPKMNSVTKTLFLNKWIPIFIRL